MKHRLSPLLQLALLFVRISSLCVPSTRRREWLEEWRGELSYGWTRAGKGPAGLRRRLRLFWRVLFCVSDGFLLRAKGWTTNGMAHDLRVVMRTLFRKPGFTLVTVATLGLGIGASTAVFALLDRVVLRPLSYPESHRLVSVLFRAPTWGFPRFGLSEAFFLQFRTQSTTLVEVAAWEDQEVTITGRDAPERVPVVVATPSLLSTLRIRPILGRGFTEDEGAPGGRAVVLLSHSTWMHRFGGEPDVLGQTLRLNGEPWEIVGVLPASADHPFDRAELWIPLRIDPVRPAVSSFSFAGIARLAQGVTREDADRELSRIMRSVPEHYPYDLQVEHMDNMGMAPYTVPFKNDSVGDVAQVLWILLGAVGLLLLIAFANVANLILVRTEGRSREVAIRRALGAGDARLARLFFIESVMLVGASALLSLGLAVGGTRLLLAMAPTSIPRLGDGGLDGSMMLFTALLSALGLVALALVPTLRHRTGDAAEPLRAGGRVLTAGRKRLRFRNVLVVSQMALALVLMVGSSLMVRSFLNLRRVDPGFHAEGVLALNLTVDRSAYATIEAAIVYWDRVLELARSVPGVETAALTNHVPLRQDGEMFAIFLEAQPLQEGELPNPHKRKRVSPQYFETLRIPILEGRAFNSEDQRSPVTTTVVSQALARRYWPGETALGKKIRTAAAAADEWMTVVGVAGSVREDGLTEPPTDAFYVPATPRSGDWEIWTMSLVTRSALQANGQLSRLRSELHALDRRVPITNVETMQSVLADDMARTSFAMALLGVAAALSILLGAVGLYAVISYIMSQRTQELGIRVALGATQEKVRGMVLRQGMALGAVGTVLGLGAALVATRFLRSVLFEVRPTDPATYATVIALLTLVVLAASYFPALRASRVDPVEALRND